MITVSKSCPARVIREYHNHIFDAFVLILKFCALNRRTMVKVCSRCFETIVGDHSIIRIVFHFEVNVWFDVMLHSDVILNSNDKSAFEFLFKIVRRELTPLFSSSARFSRALIVRLILYVKMKVTEKQSLDRFYFCAKLIAIR